MKDILQTILSVIRGWRVKKKVKLLIALMLICGNCFATGPIEWTQKGAEIKQQERQADAQERIAEALERISRNMPERICPSGPSAARPGETLERIGSICDSKFRNETGYCCYQPKGGD